MSRPQAVEETTARLEMEPLVDTYISHMKAKVEEKGHVVVVDIKKKQIGGK